MTATTSPQFPWRWIGFGAAVYVLCLLATLRADLVTSRLQPRGILASGVTGTIWNGHAAALQIGRLPLGETEWHINAWRFLTGKLSMDLRAQHDDGKLRATLAVGLGNRVGVRNLQGALPLSALNGMGLPGGWQGTLRSNMEALELEKGWPVRARGTVDATDLNGPASQPLPIGSFRVEFSGNDSSKALVATLKSIGDGPFDVAGTVRLLPDRSYVIDAQVAARPGAPASLASGLQSLGPPDAQGRRSLSMSGSL